MPTALSSTDAGPTAYVATGRAAAARRAVEDVAILFRFRKQAVRRRHLARVLSAGVPRHHPGRRRRACVRPRRSEPRPGPRSWPADALGDGGLLVLSIALGDRVRRWPRAALPRPGVAVPDQPDHRPPRRAAAGAAQHRLDDPGLDAARVDGLRPRRDRLIPAQLVMLLWLVFSTAARPGGRLVGGDAAPWTTTASPSPGGCWCAWAALPAYVQLTHRAAQVFDQHPDHLVLRRRRRRVAPVLVGDRGARAGRRRWSPPPLGAVPAHLAARRMPRDEARMETDQHEPRPMPRTVLGTPDPHRPRLGLALGADAPRPARPRARPGPRRDPRRTSTGRR